MNQQKILFMRIREYFRKNQQTNWGKNQIIKTLDKMEEQIQKEQEQEQKNSQDEFQKGIQEIQRQEKEATKQ